MIAATISRRYATCSSASGNVSRTASKASAANRFRLFDWGLVRNAFAFLYYVAGGHLVGSRGEGTSGRISVFFVSDRDDEMSKEIVRRSASL